ncbi:protein DETOXIFICATION 40-like [Hibiscus syriacus]|uniref:protein DETOXIFICATION 40-like n=1 Tax=Hibiscus syriacus TaxID=106335 RepID=UPI001921EDDB|nr:protein DETOXIFICATION 40-like [Hibiscus syriacus]
MVTDRLAALSLGASIAATIFLEPPLELSSTMSISTLMLMVSVGFNAAASVRVSNELGAGHPKSAAFTVIIVTSVSLSIAFVEAVVVLALRHVISFAFTEGETVAKAVSDLCPLFAVTLVLNGVQPVLSGIPLGAKVETTKKRLDKWDDKKPLLKK